MDRSATSSDSRFDLCSMMRCPHCGARLAFRSDQVSCLDKMCVYSRQPFPVFDGKPVLIDFTDSVFQRPNYQMGNGSPIPRDLTRHRLRSRLHRFVDGDNHVAPKNCDSFIAKLKCESENPRILIVGGGVVGLGADRLYNDSDIELIGTDVYASPNIDLLCDAHKLPFESGLFDGVWIQAVLEHVLDPPVVVAEIHRVLRPNGLVYAETPFMQQVHERAYDFTRYTLSGHRWLFRQFEEISSGTVTGPATALLWSIRYFLRALGAGEKISRVVSLPFFWIRFLDRFCYPQKAADAAGGVYFLGRRSEAKLSAPVMVEYYDAQKLARIFP